MIPINVALTYPVGTPIELIAGGLKKQFPRKAGQKQDGKQWSCETIKIQDQTGEIEVKLWDRAPLPVMPSGTPIAVGCTAGNKNATIDHNVYNGKTTVQVKVNASAQLLINGQPFVGAQQAPPPQQYPPPVQAQQYQPAPQAYQPAPAQYVPPPQQALPSQAYVPGVYPPMAQPPPTDFRQFVAEGAAADTRKGVRERINEVAGFHHDCLKAAIVSLKAIHAKDQIEFGPAEICAVAATIMIHLQRCDNVTGKGFAFPSSKPANAAQPAQPPQAAPPQVQRAPEPPDVADNDPDYPPF